MGIPMHPPLWPAPALTDEVLRCLHYDFVWLRVTVTEPGVEVHNPREVLWLEHRPQNQTSSSELFVLCVNERITPCQFVDPGQRLASFHVEPDDPLLYNSPRLDSPDMFGPELDLLISKENREYVYSYHRHHGVVGVGPHLWSVPRRAIETFPIRFVVLPHDGPSTHPLILKLYLDHIMETIRITRMFILVIEMRTEVENEAPFTSSHSFWFDGAADTFVAELEGVPEDEH